MATTVGANLLVDTYSLFFRAYHALPGMNTASGEPTAALYGFCSALLKELRERGPVRLAFAVDAPQQTFRKARFPSYKAQRDSVPGELRAQLGRLSELLLAFECPVFCVPGFEADDVLATLAHQLREQGEATLVMSGDRDLLQVARGSVRVLFLGARGQKPVIYDSSAVAERFQVSAEQLPTWAALVGDPSDNLPGVPGVGPRTASSWVREFGSVAQLLARIAEVKPERLRAALSLHGEQALLNEELARLRVDVPLGAGPSVVSLGAAAFKRLRELFAELEFKSLSARLDALERASNE
jgi:DNA polymerase-1